MPQIVTIKKSFVLFPAENGDLNNYHVVEPGSYALEAIANPFNPKSEPWLKIVGQPWGNAKSCWDALVTLPSIRTSALDSRLQIAAGILGLFCICLGALTLAIPAFKEAPVDVAALKLELLGLNNELDNLTNHYPLLQTVAQKRYEQQVEQSIYGLDTYPAYLAYRKSRQDEILRLRPDLADYINAINNLDEQLYHAWHEWGLTNRSSVIAQLKKQQLRFTSGNVMPEQSRDYRALQIPILSQTLIAATLAFDERLEQEIGDADPSLRDVARQNRDCHDRAVQIHARINQLSAQIGALEKRSKFLQTAGLR